MYILWLYICMYMYIYIYTYIHTYLHLSLSICIYTYCLQYHKAVCSSRGRAALFSHRFCGVASALQISGERKPCWQKPFRCRFIPCVRDDNNILSFTMLAATVLAKHSCTFSVVQPVHVHQHTRANHADCALACPHDY